MYQFSELWDQVHPELEQLTLHYLLDNTLTLKELYITYIKQTDSLIYG